MHVLTGHLSRDIRGLYQNSADSLAAAFRARLHLCTAEIDEAR